MCVSLESMRSEKHEQLEKGKESRNLPRCPWGLVFRHRNPDNFRVEPRARRSRADHEQRYHVALVLLARFLWSYHQGRCTFVARGRWIGKMQSGRVLECLHSAPRCGSANVSREHTGLVVLSRTCRLSALQREQTICSGENTFKSSLIERCENKRPSAVVAVVSQPAE